MKSFIRCCWTSGCLPSLQTVLVAFLLLWVDCQQLLDAFNLMVVLCAHIKLANQACPVLFCFLPHQLTVFIQTPIWRWYVLCCQRRGRAAMTYFFALVNFYILVRCNSPAIKQALKGATDREEQPGAQKTGEDNLELGEFVSHWQTKHHPSFPKPHHICFVP